MNVDGPADLAGVQAMAFGIGQHEIGGIAMPAAAENSGKARHKDRTQRGNARIERGAFLLAPGSGQAYL